MFLNVNILNIFINEKKIKNKIKNTPLKMYFIKEWRYLLFVVVKPNFGFRMEQLICFSVLISGLYFSEERIISHLIFFYFFLDRYYKHIIFIHFNSNGIVFYWCRQHYIVKILCKLIDEKSILIEHTHFRTNKFLLIEIIKFNISEMRKRHISWYGDKSQKSNKEA